MAWRETDNRMTRRRDGWDYCAPGRYMATLSLADRSRPWLAKPPMGGYSARELALELSPLGRLVEAKWLEIAANWPGVKIEEYVIMPDHIHGILRLARRQTHPLGQIVGSFKARSTAAARDLASREPGAKGAGPIVPASRRAAAIVPESLLSGKSLWSPGLTDSILWDETRRRRAVAYIADNPRRLAAKRANPDLFTVLRDIALPLPLGPGGADVAAHFTGVGNHALAARLDFHQVQCSRRYFAYRRDKFGKPLKDAPPEIETPEFRVASDAALSAAKAGAVLVNPCISPGESEIARRAFDAGAAMIILKNKGFSPLYKPEGALFDRCAEGRLLLLAPAAWPYTTWKKPITREDACALNRIAAAIARKGAASRANGSGYSARELARGYHGPVPRDIDALALAATKGAAP